MKEKNYEIQEKNNELFININQPINTDGYIQVKKYNKINDKEYEIVTRHNEFDYKRLDEGCKLIGNIGGVPCDIILSNQFANDFEQKLEKIVPKF